MTGPDHYREGERLVHQAEKLFGEYVAEHDAEGPTPNVELIRRQAEHCREMSTLHATLALAAATALLGAFSAACLEDGIEDDTLTEWYEAASEIPSGGES